MRKAATQQYRFALVVLVATSSASAAPPPHSTLLPANGEAGDWFGRSLDTDGLTAVVGAMDSSAHVFTRGRDGAWSLEQVVTPWDHDSIEFGASAGVDGSTAMFGRPGPTGSAVYVFERSDVGAWEPLALLQPDDGFPGDAFGSSLDIDDDVAIVGAPTGQGAAYIYRIVDGRWVEEAKLQADDGVDTDYGVAVGIDGDTAVVGAELFGDLPTEGAVYIYERREGAWSQAAMFVSSGVERFLGYSVAVSAGHVVAGAPFTNGAVGAANIYATDGEVWWQDAAVSPPAAADGTPGFGTGVAIDGQTVVVGIPFGHGLEPASGTALVYGRDGPGTWTPRRQLFGAPDGSFGTRVSVVGDMALADVFQWNFGAGYAMVFEGITDTSCSGDVDGDGAVDVSDLIEIILAWDSPNACADLDFDGWVGIADLNIVLRGWGADCTSSVTSSTSNHS